MLRLFPLYSRVLSTGEPQGYAEIAVFEAGTPTLATLYELDGVTPLANPFDADEYGLIAFEVEAGEYDITVSTPTNPLADINPLFEDYSYPKVPIGLAQVAEGVRVLPEASLPAGDPEGALALVNDSVGGLFHKSAYGWVSNQGREVNVQDKGALGTGLTSDLAAFQAAVAAAGNGGRVIVPAVKSQTGFYNLGAGLVVDGYTGLVIEWEGPAALCAATTAGAANYGISLYNCSGAVLKHPSFMGVAGGGGGIRIGKTDFTKLCEDTVIYDPYLPPAFDQDALVIVHGMGARIYNLMGSSDVGRVFGSSTSATLNGGIYGPNSATISAGCIRIPLQPSGQNNEILIVAPSITGYRGNGIDANGVDTLIIDGGTVQANARNYTVIQGAGRRSGQIIAEDCPRIKILGTYTETLVPGAPSATGIDNVCVVNCRQSVVAPSNYGSDSSSHGWIRAVDTIEGTIREAFGEAVYIDGDCVDMLAEDVDYGGNGGDFFDFGTNTRRIRMTQIDAANVAIGGQSVESEMNLLQNPNFQQWNSASSPVGFDIINCTATRTGTGELDTTKFQGRYACRLDTRTNATNGCRFIVDAYSDATMRAFLVDGYVTAAWLVKVTAGAVPVLSAYYDNSVSADLPAVSYDLIAGGWAKISARFKVVTGYSVLDVRLVLPENASVVYLGGAFVGYGMSANVNPSNTLSQYGRAGHHRLASSATLAFDQTNCGNFQSVVLTADVTAITLPNPLSGQVLTLRFLQDGVGGWTLAGWPGTVNWEGGVAPVLDAAAGASTLVRLEWDGTAWWQVGATTTY